jgi:alkanesulfonate monooxygenase SsuD/methylene tetrahydromethanopterin reductase-like flavin-dependent oxidoreductase (luciferase family)
VNARIELMKQTLLSVREQLADPDHQPRPVQDSIPMLVGAMSRGGLAVAAEHADVIAFSGLRQKPGYPPGR